MCLGRICVYRSVPTRLENLYENAIRLSECFVVNLDPVARLRLNLAFLGMPYQYGINYTLLSDTLALIHFRVDHLVMLMSLASL